MAHGSNIYHYDNRNDNIDETKTVNNLYSFIIIIAVNISIKYSYQYYTLIMSPFICVIYMYGSNKYHYNDHNDNDNIDETKNIRQLVYHSKSLRTRN